MSLNFGKFAKRRALLLLRIVMGVGIILAAFTLDNPVQEEILLPPAHSQFTTEQTVFEQTLASGLSKYGDWPYLLLYGVVGLAVLCLLRRYHASRILALILVAGMLAGLSSTIIRSTVGRTRPLSHYPQGFYGPRYESHWIMGKYEFGSFPSGHTATAMGLAAAIWLFNRRWALIFGTFAVAIAWSRIVLGCHHFSDVVAATVWAFLVAPALVFFLDPWLSRVWQKWFGHWRENINVAELQASTGSAAMSVAEE